MPDSWMMGRPLAFPETGPPKGPAIPLDRLQALADRYARLVWGNSPVCGPPVPLAGTGGELVAYAFPYLREPHGVRKFPGPSDLVDEIRSLRSTEVWRGTVRASTGLRRAITGRFGRFGTLYVSATRSRRPLLSISHFLHPYFSNAQLAEVEAGCHLDGGPLYLERMYFLGPHEEYFCFAGPRAKRLVHAETLSIERASRVLARHGQPPSRHAGEPGPVAEAWHEAELLGDRGLGGNRLRLIPCHQLIPVVDWTYWSSPTSLAMVLGYWDNYVKGHGALPGHGRLIEYWFDHAGSGNNIPDLIHKLIDPATGTWAGDLEATIKAATGYDFRLLSTSGDPSNDWGWNDLKAEIDAGRPLQWEAGGHAMAAFGYRLMPGARLVVLYNAWGSTAEDQHAEWSYDDGALAWNPRVNRLVPQDALSADGLTVLHPCGGEVIYTGLPARVQWSVCGTSIKTVDVLWSADGGNNWSPVANGVPSAPGDNFHAWRPEAATRRARVRIRGYDAAGGLVAGDGSHDNFTVVSRHGPEEQ